MLENTDIEAPKETDGQFEIFDFDQEQEQKTTERDEETDNRDHEMVVGGLERPATLQDGRIIGQSAATSGTDISATNMNINASSSVLNRV